MKASHAAELTQLRERVANAKANFDNAAIVGTSKELVETTAKIIMTERGTVFNDSTKAPEIVAKALRALELPARLAQPGDNEVARIAAGMYEAARAIFDLRNVAGTGHGRPSTPELTDELAHLAADAAELWVRWALHCRQLLEAGDSKRLIEQLAGEVFYAGTLTQRFEDVRLHALDEDEQLRLGIAVAHRCRQNTFVVIEDGLDAAVDNVTAWPRSYRAGLVEGLLINENGQLHPLKLPRAATLVGSIDIEDWELIVDRARSAQWGPELTQDLGYAEQVGREIVALTDSLPNRHQAGWRELNRGFVD